MISPNTSRRRRVIGVGVSLALATGLAVGSAVSASAVETTIPPLPNLPIIITPVPLPMGLITGSVHIAGRTDSATTTRVTLHYSNSTPDVTITPSTDGSFAFPFLGSGSYAITVTDTAIDTHTLLVPSLTVTGSATPVNVGALTLIPLDQPAFATSISGSPVVGQTLTAQASGYPLGSQLSYQWTYSTGNSGGAIDGATGSTYVVPDSMVGKTIGLFVTAELGPYDETSDRADAAVVTAAQKPSVAAPAPDSASLTSYLGSHSAAPAASSTVGLPTSLSPEKSYNANLAWNAGDSFVDVYAYSTPTFVGTFPVSNGTTQVTLTPAMLASLGGGSHTLVAIGQSSGTVQSVALSVSASLASTGFDPVLPIGIAAIFLLLGGSLIFVRRAQLARAATAE